MKALKKIIILIVSAVLIAGSLISINSKASAIQGDEKVYLKLERFRQPELNTPSAAEALSYKSLTDKVMWKISATSSLTGGTVDKYRTIYCIKAGPGFGSSDMGVMSEDGQIREYTKAFDLKNKSSIEEQYSKVLPSDTQKYNALVWVLEHCYVPTADPNKKEEAQAFRDNLLREAERVAREAGTAEVNIINSGITDNEIDIVQQLAVWYFTNENEYKVEDCDKYGRAGDTRQDAAQDLLYYFITEAQKAGTPKVDSNTNPISSVAQDNVVVSLVGNEYIIGPYTITATEETEYTLELKLKSATGEDITYKLLNSQKQETQSGIKSLVGQQFYLSVANTANLVGAKLKLTSTVNRTNIIYRSVENGNNNGVTEQPVAEVTREVVPYDLEILLPNLSEFDLALRKFITKINDQPVSTSRVPQVDINKWDEKGTTVEKNHPKNALVVETGDKVTYTIRIYNEGNLDGFAKEITDYLPEGLKLATPSDINTNYGWVASADGRTVKTTYLQNQKLSKFNGQNVDYKDVEIECIVTAENTATDVSVKLKNVAEITKHSDEFGNENIVDRDSNPNNLTEDQKGGYNPGSSTKGWGYQDDDDYEELVIPEKYFDLALRKFITKINDTPVSTSRVPQVDLSKWNDENTTVEKNHPKNALLVQTGDKVTYTIRIYNEGNLDGFAKEITDYLPEGLELATPSDINTKYGWVASEDGKTIKTTYLQNQKLSKFNGQNVDYKDVEIECIVTAESTDPDLSIKLKNVAEITKHSDESGNENIVDRDSNPNNLTEDQKGGYNPGSSTKGWGYQDDDDYEELTIPGKYFDLALRKFITNINGKDLKDESGKYLREPTVDVTKLASGEETTAEYKHRKNPIGVAVGDEVIYTIRVYNEGQVDGYAEKVTDYLPPQLEFIINDPLNVEYRWLYDDDTDLRTVSTDYLSKEQDELNPDRDNLLKAFDSRQMQTPDYRELKIKCRVKSEIDLTKVITNIAEITAYADKDGEEVVDRDSQSANAKIPSDNDLPDYKGNESNKSVLTDDNYHYKGQQDDDDFEKLILQEFDLALRKFITGINDEEVTNRVPKFTNKKDENGNYVYEHTKEPIEVETTDIVTYTIRIFNEGDIAGYAKEVKDDIPSGLEFLPTNETNVEYRWKMLDKDGNETQDVEEAVSIVTDYLSKEQEEVTGRDNLIDPFNTGTMNSPEYRDVKVAFKVVAPSSYEGIITNIAEISDDSDENGNDIEDRDSTPDNSDEKEDDIDKEHIKLSYFDLALRKFITAVDENEVTDRVPQFKIDEEGNYVYEHTKVPVEVENGNIVTYTLRIYNEGTKDGYAQEIKDDLPEGLLFLPENETNIEYRWKMIDENGEETENVEDAVYVVTDYLSKEQGEEAQRDNLLTAFDEETMEEPNYRDIKIAFEVTEPNTSDRILVNEAQISDDADKDGNDVVDKDSTPDKWIEEEDDQDREYVKVKYFDLSLRKWVTQAILTVDGKQTIIDTGHKAEDNPESTVKVELVESKLSRTVLKFKYKIRVTNEGEIAGSATEISDYIPKGLRFVAADNPKWKEVDGKVVTDQLKDVILQPGESAEVEIILTWINSKDNFGQMVNTAEISDDWNPSNTPDIDSTPNNEKPGEDDIDDAPVMPSIKTGVEPTYIGLIAGTLVILVAGVILIKKYVL